MHFTRISKLPAPTERENKQTQSNAFPEINNTLILIDETRKRIASDSLHSRCDALQQLCALTVITGGAGSTGSGQDEGDFREERELFRLH